MKIKASSNIAGNVLMYVMIAIVLFGALSFMLTRQMDGNSATNSLSESTDRLRAEQLINYATTVRSGIEQMMVMQNVLPTELDFVKPGAVGYADAPHAAKLYHPAGGGVSLFPDQSAYYAPGSGARGWVVQQGTNVEWTASTASDVIFSFLDVSTGVCKEINNRLYKDSAIPTTTVDSAATFIKGGGDDTDFELSTCPSCNGRVAYCIKDADGANVFYNIVLAR